MVLNKPSPCTLTTVSVLKVIGSLQLLLYFSNFYFCCCCLEFELINSLSFLPVLYFKFVAMDGFFYLYSILYRNENNIKTIPGILLVFMLQNKWTCIQQESLTRVTLLLKLHFTNLFRLSLLIPRKKTLQTDQH